jgi:hypothetical protein
MGSAALVLLALAAAGPTVKIAVMGLDSKGVDPLLVDTLGELYSTSISDLGCCSVISRQDISSMLGFEKQRQLLNCGEDAPSCIAEIGGALGVDKLASGSLGKVGDTYLLTLRLVDIRTARVEGRFSEKVAGKEDDLLAALERGVPKIFDGLLKELGIPPPEPHPVIHPAPAAATAAPVPAVAPRGPNVWGWGAIGGAVLLGGGGAWAYLDARDARARYDQQTQNGIVTTGADDERVRAGQRAILAGGLWLGAAAAGVAAVVLFTQGGSP